MTALSKTWTIDRRLAAGSFHMFSLAQVELRLVDDKRWPWVMLVPMGTDAVDVDDLPPPRLDLMMQIAADVSSTLKAMGSVSTNVGTLGNVVSAFHLHVVGRTPDDPNWPGPVWGYGAPEPFEPCERHAWIARFNEVWKQTVPLLRRI